MIIREMKEDDLKEIWPIEKDIFLSPWPKRAYKDEMYKNPFAKLFVVEDEGKIVGYCDLWITFETAQVATIGVVRNKRRQGIAQMMIDKMVELATKAQCDNISLEVRVSNEAAINLYKKNGFEIANIRRMYYSNGEDAYLMIKGLGGMDYGTITSD